MKATMAPADPDPEPGPSWSVVMNGQASTMNSSMSGNTMVFNLDPPITYHFPING